MKDKTNPHTSLRRRITVTATVSTMVASIALSLTAIGIFKSTMSDQIDRSLRRSALRPVHDDHMEPPFSRAPIQRGGPPIILQVTDTKGKIAWSNGAAQDIGGVPKPSIPEGSRNHFYTTKIDGERFRLFERELADGRVIQAARPLIEQDDYLRNLQMVLIGATLMATLIVLLLSRLLAASVLRPISTMTDAVTDISDTHDLTSRINPPFSDREVVDLADAFNELLDSIDEARRQQLRFVADASHELKTPLTGIVGNSDYLIRHANDLTDADIEAVQAISRDAQRLTTLSSNLALLGALDATKRGFGNNLVPEVQNFDLVSLISEEVGRATRAYPDSKFTFTDSGSIEVSTSPELVRRITSNLLANAALHGGDSEIVCGVDDDNRFFISVTDDGPGVSDEDLPHIFDRFWRSRQSQNTPGSGLGLAIVNESCRILKGTAQATRGPGSGLRVVVTIPLNS